MVEDDLDKLFGSIDIGQTDLIEKLRTEAENFNTELNKRSKTKEELIVSIECLIENITYSNLRTSFTPRSEIIDGRLSSSYQTGDISYSNIIVSNDTIVKELKFGGWPYLEKGDKIRAYILKGKEEFEKKIFGQERNINSLKSLLVERDFYNEEKAFKIEKLKEGEVIATYVSSTLNLFK